MKTSKKRFVKILATIIALIVTAALFSACKNRISLSSFYKDNEFQYKDAAWGTTAEIAEKTLPYKIVKSQNQPKGIKMTEYVAENGVKLFGEKGAMKFEFYEDGGLQTIDVWFRFNPDEADDFESLKNKLLKSSRRLYGDETDRPKKLYEDDEGDGLIGRMWERNRTNMQITSTEIGHGERILGISFIDNRVYEHRNDLSLVYLKQDGEFCYNNIPWGSTAEEALERLPHSLVKSPNQPTEAQMTNYDYEKEVNLNGQKGKMSFEIYEDGGLKNIDIFFKFDGEKEKDYESFKDDVLAELREYYGEETETVKFDGKENSKIYGTGYKWEAENTNLQVLCTEGNNAPSFRISLVHNSLYDNQKQ